MKDGFDTGERTNDDTILGGIIGSIVGILGGPLGVLPGLGVGETIGIVIDSTDAEEEESLIDSLSSRLKDGDVAIIAVVQEATRESYDRTLAPFKAMTVRYDAAAIREEVDHAREVEKQLEKQTREKLREKRSSARQAKRAEYKAKIKADFSKMKHKFVHSH